MSTILPSSSSSSSSSSLDSVKVKNGRQFIYDLFKQSRNGEVLVSIFEKLQAMDAHYRDGESLSYSSSQRYSFITHGFNATGSIFEKGSLVDYKAKRDHLVYRIRTVASLICKGNTAGSEYKNVEAFLFYKFLKKTGFENPEEYIENPENKLFDPCLESVKKFLEKARDGTLKSASEKQEKLLIKEIKRKKREDYLQSPEYAAQQQRANLTKELEQKKSKLNNVEKRLTDILSSRYLYEENNEYYSHRKVITKNLDEELETIISHVENPVGSKQGVQAKLVVYDHFTKFREKLKKCRTDNAQALTLPNPRDIVYLKSAMRDDVYRDIIKFYDYVNVVCDSNIKTLKREIARLEHELDPNKPMPVDSPDEECVITEPTTPPVEPTSIVPVPKFVPTEPAVEPASIIPVPKSVLTEVTVEPTPIVPVPKSMPTEPSVEPIPVVPVLNLAKTTVSASILTPILHPEQVPEPIKQQTSRLTSSTSIRNVNPPLTSNHWFKNIWNAISSPIFNLVNKLAGWFRRLFRN